MDRTLFRPAQLRRMREQAGLTIDDVARQVGRTGEMVRQYEVGQTPPPVDVLARYATAVSCSISQFFTEPVRSGAVA